MPKEENVQQYLVDGLVALLPECQGKRSGTQVIILVEKPLRVCQLCKGC